MQPENRDNEPAEKAARILVIDDEEVVHVSLARILGRRGHTVDATLKAQEGLELLQREQYDLVITDLMMPEMNGLELLAAMKIRELTVPVLMITGYPTIKTALQALRLGAVDYLAKPFTRTELLAPVHRALRRQARREGDVATPLPSALPDPDGGPEQEPAVQPGDRFRLRRHAWAVFEQEGTFAAGIEASFLAAIGPISSVTLPDEAQVLEQGYIGIRLVAADGQEHGVLMPLSGRVIALNQECKTQPSAITADTWLVRLLPDRLHSELKLLIKG
jgi:DNA-binding response OmpR family regulator